MNWIRKNKQKVIGTAVGLVFLFILIRQVSWKDVSSTFSLLTWQSLVWTFVLTVMVYGFRALRFYLLFKRQIPLKQLFYIVSAHNLANNALPARTGELSFIYLIKKYTHFSTPYSTASLLVVRLLDMVTTLVLFPVFLFFLRDIPPLLEKARIIIIIGFFAYMILGVGVLLAHERVLRRLQSKTHVKKWKHNLAKFIIEGTEVITLLKKQPATLFAVTLLSFGIWGTAFFSTYVLTSAMQIPLSFVGIAVGTTFVVLTTILPINSFLGIGVYEGAWTLATVSLGVPLELSIASGVTLHIIRVVTYVVFGLFGLRLFMAGQAKSQPKVEAV